MAEKDPAYSGPAFPLIAGMMLRMGGLARGEAYYRARNANAKRPREARPGLLLLDEPLSDLDAALREEMRVEVVRLLKAQGITAIYVIHDRIEALAMADEIVVMRTGRVAQIGAPAELYARPASAFIASFLSPTHPERLRARPSYQARAANWARRAVPVGRGPLGGRFPRGLCGSKAATRFNMRFTCF